MLAITSISKTKTNVIKTVVKSEPCYEMLPLETPSIHKVNIVQCLLNKSLYQKICLILAFDYMVHL